MALAFRPADDPYYYAQGEKLYWQSQYDVYAFRTVDNDTFKGIIDSAVVDQIHFRANYPDKLHLVYFSANSSNWQRLQVIDDIEHDIAFACSFPVVTMFENTPASAGMWYVADDQIMVMFKNDSLRTAHLERIKNEYGLTQINDPSNLPAGGTYAYVLQWDINDNVIENSVELSRMMYEHDSSIFLSVEPNLIRGYEPVWVEDSSEVSTNVNNIDSESTAATLYVVNIASGILGVHFSTNEPQYVFRMYDFFGRLLTERHLTAADKRVDINASHLSSGIYFGTLETLNGQPLATVKFLKE